MTELMTEVTISCPSCEKPLAFTEATHSYRCLACNPIPMDAPTCKTQVCQRPLTRLGEPWNCWICLHCNTHPSKVSSRQTERPDRKYIDQKMTEERVKEIAGERMTAGDIREIVRDVMVEFSTKPENDPDYPPTHAEIQTMTSPENINAKPTEKPETWLQKAKRLGIKTHIPDGRGMRKKEEIMADMEAKETGVNLSERKSNEENQSSSNEGSSAQDVQTPVGETK